MRNKKRIIMTASLLCAVLSAASAAGFAAERDINISFVVGENKININGAETEITAPYIVDDTTLVPIRVISEGLGAEVIWDEESSAVTVQDGDKLIKLHIGSVTAAVNGEEYTLPAAAELKGDTAMVPIRFISETLEAKVEWEQKAMRVTITKNAGVSALAKVDNTKWNYNAEDDVYWQVGIEYCSKPADTQYETMGIFVPAQYMNAADNGDGTFTCELNKEAKIGNYTAETAPIVIPVDTPGYMSMKAPTDYVKGAGSYTDAGFIYVKAGCRGRNEGAPAGITDLKAAVKYLRYNGGSIAGSTDRIFTFGMSGGGAQSALMGAAGDSDLYTTYLDAIGAAEGYSDAVAGSMCWCPITNLDYANEAYEWNMGITRTDIDEDMQTLSDDMAKAYAEYINALGLKDSGGNVLTLSESESGIYQAGSYYDCIKAEIERSLNNFLSDTIFPYTPQQSGPMGGAGGPGGAMGEIPGDRNFEEIDGINRIENNAGQKKEAVTYQSAQEYIDSLNKDGEWIIYDSASNTAVITSVEDFVKVCKNASKSVGAFDDLNAAQGENILFGYGDGQGAHFDPVMAELLKDNEQYGGAYAADME
ncbi:MAG: subtype A tannase, partial [Candidatus Ornithomonoglobus sp.]